MEDKKLVPIVIGVFIVLVLLLVASVFYLGNLYWDWELPSSTSVASAVDNEMFLGDGIIQQREEVPKKLNSEVSEEIVTVNNPNVMHYQPMDYIFGLDGVRFGGFIGTPLTYNSLTFRLVTDNGDFSYYYAKNKVLTVQGQRLKLHGYNLNQDMIFIELIE